MTLIEKQKTFSRLIIDLMHYAHENGYDVTLGEAYRPPETAKLYETQGKGIANSLHTLRLAIDLNLFLDGKYLTQTEDYSQMGEYWESLSTNDYKCCWGGRFEDGNHFSIEHNGTK